MKFIKVFIEWESIWRTATLQHRCRQRTYPKAHTRFPTQPTHPQT